MPRPSFNRSSGRRYRRLLGGARFRRGGGGYGTSGFKRGRTVANALTKVVDVQINNSPPYGSTGGSVIPINLVASGSGFYQRVGRTTCAKSIYITGIFNVNVGGGGLVQPTFLRCMIVYDSQANGNLPVWSDIVRSISNVNAASSTARDMLNVDTADRFKVLCDWRVPFYPQQGGLFVMGMNTPSNLYFQRFCSLKNLETKYKADSQPPVIGDIATGSLLLCMAADESLAAGAALVTMVATARFRYCDV